MNIVSIGSPAQTAECRQKFGDRHTWTVFPELNSTTIWPASPEVVFDFASAADSGKLKLYPRDFAGAVFIDTSCRKLGALTAHALNPARLFGFSGLPTFINRELLEVSTLPASDKMLLTSLCRELGTRFEIVADQAGLITPRVIRMIINEAYLTLAEGIATREDIDLAMKLGTNYPFGPFEWGERIGLRHIANVLLAAREESGDDRYRPAPLLLEQSGHA